MRKNAIAMSIATLVGALGFVGAASADVQVSATGERTSEDGGSHGGGSGGVAQVKCGAPPLVVQCVAPVCARCVGSRFAGAFLYVCI